MSAVDGIMAVEPGSIGLLPLRADSLDQISHLCPVEASMLRPSETVAAANRSLNLVYCRSRRRGKGASGIPFQFMARAASELSFDVLNPFKRQMPTISMYGC